VVTLGHHLNAVSQHRKKASTLIKASGFFFAFKAALAAFLHAIFLLKYNCVHHHNIRVVVFENKCSANLQLMVAEIGDVDKTNSKTMHGR